MSTFSPKPHTPFSGRGSSLEETRVRQACSAARLGRRRIEFRWHDAQLSYLEGLFSRGDRRTADLIETAQHLGARFDGWSDHFRMDLWRQALAEHGLEPESYLRRRPLEEALPWDHLDAGVSRKFLLQDLARAVNGLLTPDCSIERCTYCGACDFEAVKNVDYHPEGAKGGEHRGGVISRWAELVVPNTPDAPDAAWETKAWREIRARVARKKAATARPAPVTAVPLPARWPARRHSPAAPGGPRGEARRRMARRVPSSLAAERPPPPAARPPPLPKVGPARFIGTRDRQRLPPRRPPRPAAARVLCGAPTHAAPLCRPAIPLGFSSDDEYVDLD